MKRFYYISDDLDDLERIETELEASGISTPQIHVLSRRDADVEEHHLHQVQAFMKKDVVHSTEIAAMFGVIAAIVVLVVAHLTGMTQTPAGWMPFIFLAIVVLGFITWEGGLFGIQVPNVHFARFEEALEQGKHILFVETDREQESTLKQVLKRHPKLDPAGIETTHTKWVIVAQRKWKDFLNWAP